MSRLDLVMADRPAPFIRLTQTSGATLSLVNRDHIVMVSRRDGGGARVYLHSENFMSQWIDPVEDYAAVAGLLADDKPKSKPKPRKSKPRKSKPKKNPAR